MAGQLKPFSEKAECSKCGGHNIHTQWMKEDRNRRSAFKELKTEEHMKRQCVQCSFEWEELPRDTSKVGN